MRFPGGRLAAGLAVFSVLLTSSQLNAETDTVGSVVQLEGKAAAVQDAELRALTNGSGIFLHDVISSGKNSRVKMKLEDGAEITLGARSSFVVEEYVISGNTPVGVLRLVEGSARIISGSLAKFDPNALKLKTDVATIGIRGTEFISYLSNGARRFLFLSGTAITVQNDAGVVEIARRCQVAEVQSADAAPVSKGAIQTADVRGVLSDSFTEKDFDSAVSQTTAGLDPAGSDKPKLVFRGRGPDGRGGSNRPRRQNRFQNAFCLK